MYHFKIISHFCPKQAIYELTIFIDSGISEISLGKVAKAKYTNAKLVKRNNFHVEHGYNILQN